MTRPAMKYLAILVVLGVGTVGLLVRALLANRENGRARQAETCPAPAWTPPLQSEVPAARFRPEPPRASLKTLPASKPTLIAPTLIREASTEAAPELPGDKLTGELIAVQTEMARTQFQIRILEAKGLTREAGERRASLQDLGKRAATLREQVGSNPEATPVGTDQPKP
ncbi:MAG: hypothetical protein ABSF35_07165 [Polyangia bacterium]